MRKKEMIKTCAEISEPLNSELSFCMHLFTMKKLAKENYPHVSDIDIENAIRSNYDVLNEKQLNKVLNG